MGAFARTAALVLALFLLIRETAGAQAPDGPEQHLRPAIAQLIESYRQIPQGPDEELSLSAMRGDALDTIVNGGPLGGPLLREAIQSPELPDEAFWTLEALLLLVEGRAAAPFAVDMTRRYDVRHAPVESYQFAHTLALKDATGGGLFALSLLSLPEDFRFFVPAEDLALPLVPAVAFLFSASGGDAYNLITPRIRNLGETSPREVETLLQVVVQLQLVELVPALIDQSRGLSQDSPSLRPVIWALGQLGDLTAVGRLSELARKHPRAEIREEALFSLGELRSAKCESILIEGLKDPSPQARSYAVVGLALLRTSEAQQTLKNLLGGAEKDERVRRDLLKAAERTGDKTWDGALARAAANWADLASEAERLRRELADTAPPDYLHAPQIWPELPMNRVDSRQLSRMLWDRINAGGNGFAPIKKTVLYSAAPGQMRLITGFRELAAKRLTKESLFEWLDTIETLKLLRLRLRDDPWPTFSRK